MTKTKKPAATAKQAPKLKVTTVKVKSRIKAGVQQCASGG
jgi:hypothetical protein